ncbi:MAG: hypothetical protein M3P96_00845 [Actinomycetota bacterium]|nr:hypothetical protein [Actinomycetota bacterium]
MSWLRGGHALLLRFGVVSLALFTVLGLALASLMTQTVQERAVRDAERLARTLSDTAIQPHVRPEDFDGYRLSPARRDELGRLTHTIVDETAILHVSLFDAGDKIIGATARSSSATPATRARSSPRAFSAGPRAR